MYGSFEGGILVEIKFRKVEARIIKFENKCVLVELVRYIVIDIWIRNCALIFEVRNF